LTSPILRFARIALYYAVLFALFRLLFLIAGHDKIRELGHDHIHLSFYYGLRLDLSATAYLLIIPFILLCISAFSKLQLFLFHRIYHSLISFILAFVCTANLVVFHFWNALINWRALTYLSEPGQAMASATFLQSLLVIFFFLGLLIGQHFLFRFIAGRSALTFNEQPVGKKVTALLLLLAFEVICLRGGLNELPVNESSAYYSEHEVLNLAAVNPLWHLAHDVYYAGISTANPYAFTDDKKAGEEVNRLFECTADSIPEILTTTQPNVVIIILESFTADVVAELAGEKNVAPAFNQLAKDGLLFTNVYASGFRTDQGIVSVISGFPAIPSYSIMRNIEKSAKLPSLADYFRKKNYATSFYYGGSTDFSNMRSYLINSRFEKIINEHDFDAHALRNKWGVHDEFVLDKQGIEMNTMAKPFFSVIMTLSCHEPFDVPGEKSFSGSSEADQFRNAAAYSDHSLGQYFEKVRTLPWFSKTLFILVADHGHELPGNRNMAFPEGHHIPVLFYGDVIKKEFRGMQAGKTGGHHDIAATLLSQLDTGSTTFSWSKNLLDKCPGFGYYELDDGFGWIENNHWTVFLKHDDRASLSDSTLTTDEKEILQRHGKGFLQKLFGNYLAY